MKGKRKILIFASGQFGYSTTIFKYCEYSLQKFDITYIGWDYKLPKIGLPGVEVKYVSRETNLLSRNFRLLKAFHEEIQKGYDLIFSTYVRGISIVKQLNRNSKFLIFIDTFGVMPNSKKRWIYDTTLKFEVSFFQNVAVISEGLARRLEGIECEILPLGGECFNNKSKTFEKLELLYVGTLDNRNIIDCVRGFHKYLQIDDFNQNKSVFKIIGNGPNNELKILKEYVQIHNLTENVHILGYLPQKELAPYFKSANIGVCYVPILSYYEYQTPTKTFEYLISGLPVIATGIYENRKIIKPWSGVIIEDNADAFCNGMVRLEKQKEQFSYERISKEYSKHTWKNIVNSYFIPLAEKLINS